MGNYAKINPLTKKVTNIIVADQEHINTLPEPDLWIKTSYNTYGGVHYDPETGEPSEDQSKALRYNKAGIDWHYDPEADAFYEPQPFPSWTLNRENFLWEAPVSCPDDGNIYVWDEENQAWIKPGY